MDPHSDTNSEYERIMELANDVNNSLDALDENEKRKKRRETESEEESEDSASSRRSNGSNGKRNSAKEADEEEDAPEENEEDDAEADPITDALQDGYGMMIIEPLLLLTIYVILSQPFAINFASNYIDQLNPNEDGTISLMGIIIYGVILVLMFMVLRRIVEYKIGK